MDDCCRCSPHRIISRPPAARLWTRWLVAHDAPAACDRVASDVEELADRIPELVNCESRLTERSGRLVAKAGSIPDTCWAHAETDRMLASTTGRPSGSANTTNLPHVASCVGHMTLSPSRTASVSQASGSETAKRNAAAPACEPAGNTPRSSWPRSFRWSTTRP